MQGLGFMIWKLSRIQKKFSPVSFASMCRDHGIRWLSWKCAEYDQPYNQVGGNDKVLIEYMQACEAAGIESGGWGYQYPDKPGAQAGRIAERIAKYSGNLNRFGHWMINVEREWKKQNLGQVIDALLSIDINAKFPVGYCSYRYPESHAEMNHARFLKHPTIKFTAPQVYWLGAHNPRVQLEETFRQYSKLTSIQFVPIGCTFNYGSWFPSAQELRDFVAHCIERRWYTYGFYSLDWIIENGRMDYLAAISGQVVNPPPPMSTHVVTIAAVNPRTRPVIADDTDAGTLVKGKVFEKVGPAQDGWQAVKIYVSEKLVENV